MRWRKPFAALSDGNGGTRGSSHGPFDPLVVWTLKSGQAGLFLSPEIRDL